MMLIGVFEVLAYCSVELLWVLLCFLAVDRCTPRFLFPVNFHSPFYFGLLIMPVFDREPCSFLKKGCKAPLGHIRSSGMSAIMRLCPANASSCHFVLYGLCTSSMLNIRIVILIVICYSSIVHWRLLLGRDFHYISYWFVFFSKLIVVDLPAILLLQSSFSRESHSSTHCFVRRLDWARKFSSHSELSLYDNCCVFLSSTSGSGRIVRQTDLEVMMSLCNSTIPHAIKKIF